MHPRRPVRPAEQAAGLGVANHVALGRVPVQRAAEAAYSPAGQMQVRGLIDFYLPNPRPIREGIEQTGLHAIMWNAPADGEPLRVTEVGDAKVRNG